MNAADCRASGVAGHECVDKFGEPWDRADAGPRPGTTCWYETMCRLEDDRKAERDELAEWAGYVDRMTTLEQVVSL